MKHMRDIAEDIPENILDFEKRKSYRLPGESYKNCVGRKTGIMIREGHKPDQASAAAHDMCKDNSDGDLSLTYSDQTKLNDATLGEYAEAIHSKPERTKIFRSTLINYLGRPYHEIQKINEVFPPYRSHLLRYALIKLFPIEKTQRILNFESWGDEEMLPPEYVTFTTGKEVLKGLLTGTLFLDAEETGKVVLSVFPGYMGRTHVQIYSPDLDNAYKTLKLINDYIRDNNFLKGQKLYHNGSFMKFPNTKWEDVILPEDVKKKLQVHVIDYLANLDERVAKGLPSKRGVLLIGPPGNGKTLIGKALANSTEETFIWCPFSEADLADVFMMARELAPSLVFIEDMATQGGLDRRSGQNSSIGTLLNMMDGIEENDKVFTLATENHIGLLDNALGDRPGRFDIIIPLPNPAESERAKILRHYLPDQSDENIELLARDTEDFSGSHLRELATRVTLENITPDGYDAIIDEVGNVFSDLAESDLKDMYGKRTMGRRGKRKKKTQSIMKLWMAEEDTIEKGLTPKIISITNKPVLEKQLKTVSKVIFGDNWITCELREVGEDAILAKYKCEVRKDQKATPTQLGLLEGLVVARLATEVPISIQHNLTYPVPKYFDELLTEYGMGVVKFSGDIYENIIPFNINKGKTLLFSGGADSTQLLFKHLKGEANVVTLWHGQGTFYAGTWPEKKAAETVVQLARDSFKIEVPHTFLKARWTCSLKRDWAKAYRNFLSVVQASISYPQTSIWLGTNLHDALHDCSADLIEEFITLTGLQIEVPNLRIGRREIMRDLISMSLEKYPYLYASTASCQMSRFIAQKHLFCGSCHSCLLRLPAIEFNADPRFDNFDKNLKVIPEVLEDRFTAKQYYKTRPSTRILKTFFNDFSKPEVFTDFVPALKIIKNAWPDYDLSLFLDAEQIELCQE